MNLQLGYYFLLYCIAIKRLGRLTRLQLARLTLVWLTLARLTLTLARLTLARLTTVRLTLAQLTLARLTVARLTQLLTRNAEAASFSAAPHFHTFATAANFTTTTDHCCSGLSDDIIDDVLVAGTPDRVDPDEAASVIMVESFPAGSAASAYTVWLTFD